MYVSIAYNFCQIEDGLKLVTLEDWQPEQVLPIARDLLNVKFTSDATDAESGFDITYKAVGRYDNTSNSFITL